MKLNKRINFFLLFIILLLFIKTDYRLETGIYCCKDDHDYYAHAETLVIDLDFDYSNQFVGNEEQRFYYNGKTAPSAFIGAGILSAPFLFVGNLVDNLFPNNEMFNFKIIFYSFSSIFYLIFTFLLLNKINKLLNSTYSSYSLYLFLLGSGIGFYVFERYSMSHIYEVFAVTLLIYHCVKFYKEPNQYVAFSIPLLIMLSLMTRWVNVYVLIIPLVISKLLNNKKNLLHKYKNFWLSSFLSIFVFLYHTYLVYGVVTLNPEFTYNTSGTIERYLGSSNSFIDFFWTNFKNLFLVFFGSEFGLFWFSPIIFFGIYLTLKNFVINYKTSKIKTLLLLLCFLQVLSLVLIWKSTGSSYGFRYVMNLAPLSILILLCNAKLNKIEKFYLKAMSIFAILSVIYFETTPKTQLSIEYINNIFDKNTKFSRPDYLTGYISSFFEIDAYLKIFSQSYLGFIIFYVLIFFLGQESFYDILSRLSLPYDNPDFQLLIEKIINIEGSKVLTTILLVSYLSYTLIKKTENHNLKV